jgi:hypothetical protein
MFMPTLLLLRLPVLWFARIYLVLVCFLDNFHCYPSGGGAEVSQALHPRGEVACSSPLNVRMVSAPRLAFSTALGIHCF